MRIEHNHSAKNKGKQVFEIVYLSCPASLLLTQKSVAKTTPICC